MKVALLPKKTRGGTVVATLTLRFGDEKTPDGQGDGRPTSRPTC